jgi:pyruvate/2-oxoglutarate dehydrogenase complex dihydrolipoamide dehydrogenase (E3) component
MPREDRDVAQSIRELLEAEGIRVLIGASATALERAGEDEVLVHAVQDGRPLEVRGSHLLVAIGTQPNTKDLNLDRTSIETDSRGFIQVDDFCRTTAEGVFAVGDVNGHGAFTHTSVNDAEIVLDHLFGGPRRLSSRIPVYALFSDPPLGRVGMTEKEALASGRKVLKATRPMKQFNRAIEMGETHGFAKLLVDGDTDLILGASILGPGADEVINMFAAIMHSGITCSNYRQVVLVHPTVSEIMPWILKGIKEAKGGG